MWHRVALDVCVFWCFVSRATCKTFKIFCLYSQGNLTFMENPIIGIAVKFQYNIPTLRTLVVMDTISWSSGSTRWSAQKELCFPTKILNTFLCPHLWKWCWKPFSGMLILFIILIVVVVVDVVYDDTYYWVYWSSDHQFQVYYIVRQLLLQGATAHFITKCTGLLLQSAIAFFITKSDKCYYKVRQFYYKVW